MKLLILILALSYHHIASAHPGDYRGYRGYRGYRDRRDHRGHHGHRSHHGYTLVDPQEVNNDQSIQDALTFGARYVIEQGIQDDLPNSNYEVTGVYSVFRQFVRGFNYKFDVELTNSEGTKIRANYVVYVQPWTDTRFVTDWSYTIEDSEFDIVLGEVSIPDEEEEEEDSGVPGAWSQVDLSNVDNDSEIQDLLNYGVRYITMREAIAGQIPYAQYRVNWIFSVYKQVVSGTNYRFDVLIGNKFGLILRATFVAFSQPWSNIRDVTTYTYDFISHYGVSFDEEDVPRGYLEIDPADRDTNIQLSNAFNYGVQAITNRAVSEHRLPPSDYQVIEIHSIYGRFVAGMKYRFDVSLRNCAGLVARVVFHVDSRVWADRLKVDPISLRITNIPEQGLIGGDCLSDEAENDEEGLAIDEELILGIGVSEEDDGVETTENNEEEVVTDEELILVIEENEEEDEGETTEINEEKLAIAGELVNEEDGVETTENNEEEEAFIDEELILVIGEIEEEGEGEATENNEEEFIIDEEWILVIEGNEEEDGVETTGGFFPIALDEANNDPEIQQLLNFGAQFVIAEGIKAGRIPESAFKVSNLFSVERQVVSGLNYRYDVELQDCHGFTIRANYIVYYQSWTNTIEVSDYSFDIIAAPNTIGGCPIEEEEENQETEQGEIEQGEIEQGETEQVETEWNIEDTLAGVWSEIPLDQISSNRDIITALGVGVQQFIEQAVQAGVLRDQQFLQNQLLRVEEQVVSEIRYLFDVVLKGNSGALLNVELIVYSQSHTNAAQLSSYHIVSMDP